MSKTTKIDNHTIEYWWNDGKDRKNDETDRKLISRLLKMGLVEGELNQYDHETEEVVSGWWVLAAS